MDGMATTRRCASCASWRERGRRAWCSDRGAAPSLGASGERECESFRPARGQDWAGMVYGNEEAAPLRGAREGGGR